MLRQAISRRPLLRFLTTSSAPRGGHGPAKFPDAPDVYSPMHEQRLWGLPKLPDGQKYPNQGWEFGWFLIAVVMPIVGYVGFEYGPTSDIYDWAREEVMLTPEKPIVGRPMSEIYPDYDVTTTEVKRYN